MAELVKPSDLNFLKGGPRPGVDLHDPAQNSEHIENIPAGRERDEARAIRQGFLEEQAEGTENFSLDPRQLEIENELAQYFSQDSGEIPIENADSRFHYHWAHVCGKNGCQEDARTIARLERGIRSNTTGRVICYERVRDTMREAKNLEGKHCAGGTT